MADYIDSTQNLLYKVKSLYGEGIEGLQTETVRGWYEGIYR